MTSVLSSDGVRIAFDEMGDGPPVLVVASALADRSDAKRLSRHLSNDFRVLNYDRRGRGQSGDAGPYSVEREIDDLAALIERVGGAAFVFGSSSGAVLALEAADRLGGSIPRLALFEPPFIVDQSRSPLDADYATQIQSMVSADRSADAVRHFLSAGLGMPTVMVAAMRFMPGWSKMKRLAKTLPYDLDIMQGTQEGTPLPSDRWQNVAAPTLVLTGEKSDSFLRRGAEQLVDRLPSARHQTVKGANHAAVVAAPKSLAAELGSFFRE